MRLVISYIFLFFINSELFSQDRMLKVSLTVYIDNVQVSEKKPKQILISNGIKNVIFSVDNKPYILIDSSFLNSATVNIDFAYSKYMLRFDTIGNRLKNYDIKIYIFTKLTIGKQANRKLAYKYCLEYVPRLTKRMIQDALKNGTPYNSFRTKDYYVY